MEEGIIFVLGGVFLLAAIGFRWAWFMNNYKVKWVAKMLGRTGATVFYVVCGLTFVTVGILMIIGIID